jgi:glutaminase
MMNYQKILDDIYLEIQPELMAGKVADYIPALADIPKGQFSMTITLKDGSVFSVGQSDQKFSIQSISKVFTFTMALAVYGEKLYERVGVEPSGNAFNSLVQLEYEAGIPRNPFINAGAIAITDALFAYYKHESETIDAIMEFIRKISVNEKIFYDTHVAKSEMEHGDRNLALARLMRSFGNFETEVKGAVMTYCKHCAITMNTEELSRAMLFLAFSGTDPITGNKIVDKSRAKRINAVMLTCGHYDASGEFAFNVGLPAKSGVGGGIAATIPGEMSIAVWSPGLNKYGNSHVGTLALEKFTTKTGLSIF